MTLPRDLTICQCGAPLNGEHDTENHQCIWHNSVQCEWCLAVETLEFWANSGGSIWD